MMADTTNIIIENTPSEIEDIILKANTVILYFNFVSGWILTYNAHSLALGWTNTLYRKIFLKKLNLQNLTLSLLSMLIQEKVRISMKMKTTKTLKGQ